MNYCLDFVSSNVDKWAMSIAKKIDKFFATHSGEELTQMYNDLNLEGLVNVPDIQLLPDDNLQKFLQEMAEYRERTRDVNVGEY